MCTVDLVFTAVFILVFLAIVFSMLLVFPEVGMAVCGGLIFLMMFGFGSELVFEMDRYIFYTSELVFNVGIVIGFVVFYIKFLIDVLKSDRRVFAINVNNL